MISRTTKINIIDTLLTNKLKPSQKIIEISKTESLVMFQCPAARTRAFNAHAKLSRLGVGTPVLEKIDLNFNTLLEAIEPFGTHEGRYFCYITKTHPKARVSKRERDNFLKNIENLVGNSIIREPTLVYDGDKLVLGAM